MDLDECEILVAVTEVVVGDYNSSDELVDVDVDWVDVDVIDKLGLGDKLDKGEAVVEDISSNGEFESEMIEGKGKEKDLLESLNFFFCQCEVSSFLVKFSFFSFISCWGWFKPQLVVDASSIN